MSFVSWAFAALFAVVLLARLTVGRHKVETPYIGVLLVASAVFYAWHVPLYLFVLIGSALVDYSVGLALGRLPLERRTARRRRLLISLVSNLGLLGLFKYGDFFTRVAEDVAVLAGGSLRLDGVHLVLPMGISFYTFQTLSYTIDVYRGRLQPVRNFPRFLLYISFFPQLVAGPIVRASEFLPQMPRRRRLRLPAFYEGTWLIICGLFLKMVCADNLAAYVDEHWERASSPGSNATFNLWLSLMFSGQIFADFCGYSTIARGLGYLLGYRFPINFNAPYIAGTFKNFWERWHMTLSRWLRDYLYLPLGGNRGSRARTALNLMIVMLLGGLWHGAEYTYVVWGAIHGVCLAVERALKLHRTDGRARSLAIRAGWYLGVQAAVLVAWVFFRSPSIGDAGVYLANLATGEWRVPAGWMLASTLFLAPLVAMHVWTWLEEGGQVSPLGATAKASLAAAMTYAILTLYTRTSDFIYFQF